MTAVNPLAGIAGNDPPAFSPAMLFTAIALALAGLQGCTAMAPQYAAQQSASSYYEGGYNSLTPQQKLQLEDHLANQSNQAWQTTAQVMSGAGRLMSGTGSMIGALRSMQNRSIARRPHTHIAQKPRQYSLQALRPSALGVDAAQTFARVYKL
jgi:hypothetical protein